MKALLPNNLFGDALSHNLGMGGHSRGYRGNSDNWLTPKFIIDALGPFALDPCHNEQRPFETAQIHYTESGLEKPWAGFIWLNPPYGPQTWEWLDKLSEHPWGGIALTFARTETEGFSRSVWGKADCLFFLKSRLFFLRPDGTPSKHNSGCPSVLAGYGREAKERLHRCNLSGVLVDCWEVAAA